jgi:hypothetical protein
MKELQSCNILHWRQQIDSMIVNGTITVNKNTITTLIMNDVVNTSRFSKTS